MATEPFEFCVEKGHLYSWCACGLSKKNPLCDSSHRGSGRKSLKFTAETTEKVWLCGCKQTKTPPFCDGSHKILFKTQTSKERATPLEALHRRLNAKLVPFAGYQMPLNYPSGILAEHAHVRSKAGLFDVSHMGVIEVTGEQAAKRLERLIPLDIQEMQPGQVKYGFLLNGRGGIGDDLLLTCLPDKFVLVVNASRKEWDFVCLKSICAGPECAIRLKENTAILALQGPKASKVLQTVCPEAPQLKFMHAESLNILGEDMLISRTGYTGEDGFEIMTSAKGGQKLAEQLLSHSEVDPIGLGARDSLRLEGGLCLYGQDLTLETTPVEAGLIWALGKRRRAEGGFCGDEVILPQLAAGSSRRRVGLIIEGRAVARTGAALTTPEGQPAGQVTSGIFSPTLQIPIAMGYVTTAFSKKGQLLMVDVRGKKLSATVTGVPFVPLRYYKG